MEIRVLRYFLVTAREQNITKAAELLHITQPTLSRQLAALEEELGTSLFIRGNKKITLTEKGILLKRRARRRPTSGVSRLSMKCITRRLRWNIPL